MPNKVKSDLEKDPLLELGYGIVLYRDMLLLSTYYFLFLTIIYLPLMYSYKSGEGFLTEKTYGDEIWSLGNLGQSKVVCNSGPFDVATMTVTC